VDDAPTVSVGEARAHVQHDLHRALDGEARHLGEQDIERGPFEQLHREPHEAAPLLAEVDDTNEAGVIEDARGLRLGEEARPEARVLLVVRVEDLHRHRLGQEHVLRAVDDPERAGADALFDDQLAAETSTDDRIERGRT
jgi:hypothetical protein